MLHCEMKSREHILDLEEEWEKRKCNPRQGQRSNKSGSEYELSCRQFDFLSSGSGRQDLIRVKKRVFKPERPRLTVHVTYFLENRIILSRDCCLA